jgi:hypothetical protein
MPKYYVNRNAQPNGDHEVHMEGCPHMPHPDNRYYLGEFEGCYGAVLEAKEIFPTADGCYYCCAACHKR